MVSKFHYVLHLPWQYQRHGILFPCFVHERKHRELKRFASDIRNTAIDFEKSLLQEITVHHAITLEDSVFSLGQRLIHAVARPPAAAIMALREAVGADAAIALANQARFSEWGIATKGDVVMATVEGQKRVGRIFLVASIDGSVVFAVAFWTFVRRCKGGSVWSDAEPLFALIDADPVMDTVMWAPMAAPHVRIITPKA